jgi:uncharacterized protein (DUF1330 family)
MAAYVIVNVEVQDPALYEEYKKASSWIVPKHGGKFIARGGKVEVLEGDWQPRRVVILEFENADEARAWYRSEDYREPMALRHALRGSLVPSRASRRAAGRL